MKNKTPRHKVIVKNLKVKLSTLRAENDMLRISFERAQSAHVKATNAWIDAEKKLPVDQQTLTKLFATG